MPLATRLCDPDIAIGRRGRIFRIWTLAGKVVQLRLRMFSLNAGRPFGELFDASLRYIHADHGGSH